jgi:hypothetical protein
MVCSSRGGAILECAMATAAMFSLGLVVEAEACSAYQSNVGERGCKPDQAAMVVPRVSGCCRCSGGGVSEGVAEVVGLR